MIFIKFWNLFEANIEWEINILSICIRNITDLFPAWINDDLWSKILILSNEQK